MGKIWTRKPPSNYGINLDHPLSMGLDYCVSMQDLSGREVASRLVQHTGSAPNSFVNSSHGLAIHGVSGESNTAIIHNNAFGFLTGTDKLTVAVIARQRVTSALDVALVSKHRSGFGAWQIIKTRDNGSNVIDFQVRDATNQQLGAGITYSSSENGIWRLFVGTYDGKTGRLYFDGIEKGNTTFTVTSTVIDRDYQVGVFATRTTITEASWDIAATFGWGNRVLTPVEIAQWNQNWWQLFKSKKQFALVSSNVRFVTVKKPWTSQPPAGTPLRRDGIAAGMRFCATANRGAPFEEVLREPGTITGSATIEATDIGLAVQNELNLSGSKMAFSKHYEVHNGLSNLTVFCLAKNRKTSIAGTGSESPMSHAGGGDDGWELSWWQTEDFVLGIDTGTTTVYGNITNGLDPVDGQDATKWNALGGHYDGSNVYARVNNEISVGAPQTGNTVVSTSLANLPSIGGGDPAASTSWDGWVALGILWDRVLSDEEWSSMVDNPWQIFEPQTIHVPLANINAFDPPATTVLITDVNVTDSWIDGDTGLIITGSGFV